MEDHPGIYAWSEWVNLNVCNIGIFKTPVGWVYDELKGARSRSQKAVGAHDSQASQKAVGVEHLSAEHPSLSDIFRESKYCLIISYSAGTGVSLISYICVSYFRCIPSHFPPPLFVFLQVININSGKIKSYLYTFQMPSVFHKLWNYQLAWLTVLALSAQHCSSLQPLTCPGRGQGLKPLQTQE